MPDVNDQQPYSIQTGATVLYFDEGLIVRKGRSVHLGPSETMVLKLLMEADGKVVATEDLLLKVWPEANTRKPVNVRAAIRRLRLRLKDTSAIETIGGEGYRFAG